MLIMQTFITRSAEETQKLAQKLAKKYSRGGVLALEGPLGSGKTTFIQGFAKGLGISQRLISPTFILIRQYAIPGQPLGKLHHIDLYRLDNTKQIIDLGLEEVFSNPYNIVLIEWAKKLGKLLPKETTAVQLKILSNNKRGIQIKD